MKTDSMYCSLSKKCKEEYSKEVGQRILSEEKELENIYTPKSKIEESK